MRRKEKILNFLNSTKDADLENSNLPKRTEAITIPDGSNPIPQPMEGRHYIYIMILLDHETENIQFLKIGKTMDLEYRLSSIDYYCNYKVQIVHYRWADKDTISDLEYEIHHRFVRIPTSDTVEQIYDGFTEIHNKDNLLAIYDLIEDRLKEWKVDDNLYDVLNVHTRFYHQPIDVEKLKSRIERNKNQY
ncbi:GIY-YIG nuclease family protein [Aeromonas salmonicida]|uniref:GIY-YIG nuclease family protein n=1 Tax=Aeromonas salmonicida TaxID=645 RepID=UPI003D2219A4